MPTSNIRIVLFFRNIDLHFKCYFTNSLLSFLWHNSEFWKMYTANNQCLRCLYVLCVHLYVVCCCMFMCCLCMFVCCLCFVCVFSWCFHVVSMLFVCCLCVKYVLCEGCIVILVCCLFVCWWFLCCVVVVSVLSMYSLCGIWRYIWFVLCFFVCLFVFVLFVN